MPFWDNNDFSRNFLRILWLQKKLCRQKRARISAQDAVENIIRFLENQNDDSDDNDSEGEFSDAENDLEMQRLWREIVVFCGH